MIDKAELEEVGLAVKSFRCSDLYQSDETKKSGNGKSRLVFHMCGQVCLPPADQEDLLKQVFLTGSDDDIDNILHEFFSVDIFPTEPPDQIKTGAKVVELQGLFTSVCCSLGGTKTLGKAPRSALAYKLMAQLQLA